MRARGAVVLTLLAVLLLSALYPVRQYLGQKAELRRLAAEEASLNRRIRELGAQRAALLTDAEIERIAREELGMVRPGEVAFVVVPPRDPATAARPPTAPSVDQRRRAPRQEPWYERWWDAFVGSLTLIR